ncbi:conserved hypothetical protein [Pediculus humanus corporis]|uniref:Calmodulin-lysine N-methyltransferase n=1 Tax=Pediculus humanus subsp. corporis TaxID=121224 RepID=E0VP32_PEDHC|nr:uncharacterized protein Phum_PHUM350990 [Pediculus humanus corporis]EEB15138.1 conserved hypothetical protein [Pediculus humanus corporis]
MPEKNEVLKNCCPSYFGKKEIARKRWKLLARVLIKTQKTCTETFKLKCLPVRRLNTFDLIKPIITEEGKDGYWFEYSTKILNIVYRAQIHHLNQKLTATELIGFNNTGNIRVWPSEEVLTYYLLTNINIFKGKHVLELGGGMTCLAGIFLAIYGNANQIDLTDGNTTSVENVMKIIEKNNFDSNKVKAYQLDWKNHKDLNKSYDIVISSDCLFFNETREDLVETFWNSLKEDGLGLIMAPKRGNTLNLFLNIANKKGFKTILQTYYNDIVWNKHLQLKNLNSEYNEDLNYPLLIMLYKINK